MASYITHVEIPEFRTIKGVEIDLRPEAGSERPFRHLIFTGPNGSGKSSALLWIVQQVGSSSSSHLRWSAPRTLTTTVVYIPTHRRLAFAEVKGPAKLPLNNRPDITAGTGLSKLLLQYLVNRKTEQAFANIDKDRAKEQEIDSWFAGFEGQLRWLFEDPRLTLVFDSKRFDFTIHRGDGTTHGLQQLADGHAAFLSIFADITLAIEAARDQPGPPGGVVIVDEIENHLHLRLQEQALPFLTELFPAFQFITATHSPAVIASVPNAVVYDMARRTATASEEFVGVRYGSLMTGHFHLPSDFDLDSTEKLEELRRLAEQPAGREGQIEALADLLSRRSSTLAYEVWRILHEQRSGAEIGAE